MLGVYMGDKGGGVEVQVGGNIGRYGQPIALMPHCAYSMGTSGVSGERMYCGVFTFREPGLG